MNTQLLAHLQALGKNVRPALTKHPLTGGCAVVIIDENVWPQSGIQPYSIGLTTGPLSHYKLGLPYINFGSPAHKASDCTDCHVSGGPSTDIPQECLRETGIEIELPFRKCEGNLPWPDNLVTYHEYVPLFEFYQSEQQALVKRIEIDVTEYQLYKKVHPSISIDSRVFVTGYVQDPETRNIYSIHRLGAFAIPKVHTYEPGTAVLTVYYEEIYKKVNSRLGKDAYLFEFEDYKPTAYFKQDMRVYSPSCNPISDIKRHYGGILHCAFPYYEHDRG